ncbi:hypothetical protein AB0L57_22290 [Nocardia sp. NPDC052254]|uniref:hypothetical protein n=1 Tax=Nocardia sp. NPDC052254 TaxID=3155681 RepID=UPI00343FF93B
MGDHPDAATLAHCTDDQLRQRYTRARNLTLSPSARLAAAAHDARARARQEWEELHPGPTSTFIQRMRRGRRRAWQEYDRLIAEYHASAGRAELEDAAEARARSEFWAAYREERVASVDPQSNDSDAARLELSAVIQLLEYEASPERFASIRAAANDTRRRHWRTYRTEGAVFCQPPSTDPRSPRPEGSAVIRQLYERHRDIEWIAAFLLVARTEIEKELGLERPLRRGSGAGGR